MRRVIALGLIGTTIEWYDYYLFIYAALLAFPSIFFPSKEYLISLLASVSSYAIAFFARPLGAAIFGHLGDRIGRRHALSFDLILVGLAMIFVGVLPGYSVLGIIAPLLVFAIRFVQGLGVGGEWGGVSTWVSEHLSKRRATFTSVIQIASPLGFIGAATVLLIFPSNFSSIGWRVGFIAGGIAALLGALLRYLATESLPFNEIKTKGEIAKIPSVEVFKNFWKEILLLTLAVGGVFIGVYIPATVMPSLYLTQVQKETHIPSLITLLGAAVPLRSLLIYVYSIGGIVSMPLFAMIADRVGRKKSLILGNLLIAITSVPYVYMFLSGNLNEMLLAQFLIGQFLIGFSAYAPYASMAAFYPEIFPVKFRYSGSSYGLQLAAALEGGLMPILLIALLGNPSEYLIKSWEVATFLGAWGLISLVSTIPLKETKNLDLVRDVNV
ncbi:MHS family MFS transporter [Metallosphaera tengchongensis]|uniref:MHS family MFS transporter n=1 Tax=Metallosphaera tengchongensis TaxID=1532350 RepID=A0A6N0NUC8_9CREN|nr:MFS transporter [Metallosphaera tengchongensis]QKQ99764.1 MHS family MFS transporter [Metallosphaera tengchongensis]